MHQITELLSTLLLQTFTKRHIVIETLIFEFHKLCQLMREILLSLIRYQLVIVSQSNFFYLYIFMLQFFFSVLQSRYFFFFCFVKHRY